jgi:putative transposase
VPEADLAIMRRLDRLHLELPFAGSRMLRGLLAAEGCKIGRRHVKTLMKRMGIEALYRRPRTTKPEPGHKIYPYLLRGMEITRPNQVWAMDITYIPMARGFVYLAVVLDWFSRRVLSWRLSITMEAAFCVETLEDALAHHGKPDIFNTDQGSQFTGAPFTGVLIKNGIAISMDGKGAWRDNVFVERLWRSVKYEEVVCCERDRFRKRSRCFIKDEGRSLEVGMQMSASNHHKLRLLRATVVSVVGKGGRQIRQVWSKETNVSEPLMTCRNVSNRRRNRNLDFYSVRRGWERAAYCPTGVRHEGGVTLEQALIRNTGTCRSDAKGETQAARRRKSESTDAEHRGGGVRSRVEGAVMGLDRRGVVIQLYRVNNLRGEDLRG